MTKIFTVKSNARRACKKQGLSLDLVVAVDGGWIIQEPSQPAKETKTKIKKTKKPANGNGASKKRDALRGRLAGGWAAVPDMCNEFGWLPHTLRGAISTLAKSDNLKVERQRESGITSYRVVA